QLERAEHEEHHQAGDALVPLPRRRPAAQAPEGLPGAEPTPTGGLPRRVRQASLAPQLRKDPEGPRDRGTTGPDPAGPEPGRDADEVRARMAALQRGWQRAREHNEADATERSPRTAPRTTSEGDGR
ncbi:histidine kinase, partial [Streptomyces sp. URMC 127]